MYSRQFFKTLLVPAAALIAEEELQDSPKKGNLCRPSELPIYVPDPPPLAKEPEQAVPTYLEDGFGTVRQQVTKVYTEVKAYQRVGTEYIEQSKDNAEWLLKYLRQEDNTTPKAGAIAIGGLTGFIFGLRGRFIKRTLYSATGALGMAALCYPKEASEYSQIALTEAKKYATIAYNFAYGGGEQIEANQQVINTADGTKTVTELTEEDAHTIVSKTYDESTSKSCHCPVGACLGHHDENNAS